MVNNYTPVVNIQDLVRWRDNQGVDSFDKFCQCMIPKYERMIFEWSEHGVTYYAIVVRLESDEDMQRAFYDEYVSDDAQVPEGIYWELRMDLYLSHKNIIKDVHAGEVIMHLDKLGREVPPHSLNATIEFSNFAKPYTKMQSPDKEQSEAVYELLSSIWVSNLALTLGIMQIKNVELVDGYPTHGHQQWLNRTIGEGVQQKIVRVFPMKKTKRNPNYRGVSVEKIFRRGSVVGAHLKTYTEERPLFGKYSGTFLIPQHTRAGTKKGQVNKDYEIRMDK